MKEDVSVPLSSATVVRGVTRPRPRKSLVLRRDVPGSLVIPVHVLDPHLHQWISRSRGRRHLRLCTFRLTSLYMFVYASFNHEFSFGISSFTPTFSVNPFFTSLFTLWFTSVLYPDFVTFSRQLVQPPLRPLSPPLLPFTVSFYVPSLTKWRVVRRRRLDTLRWWKTRRENRKGKQRVGRAGNQEKGNSKREKERKKFNFRENRTLRILTVFSPFILRYLSLLPLLLSFLQYLKMVFDDYLIFIRLPWRLFLLCITYLRIPPVPLRTVVKLKQTDPKTVYHLSNISSKPDSICVSTRNTNYFCLRINSGLRGHFSFVILCVYVCMKSFFIF